MTNKQKILNYLASGEWKCFANTGFYMKDDRTRISELRKMGYIFDEKPCDGRCGVKHDSRIYMRRLVGKPGDYTKPEPLKPNNYYFSPAYYADRAKIKTLDTLF